MQDELRLLCLGPSMCVAPATGPWQRFTERSHRWNWCRHATESEHHSAPQAQRRRAVELTAQTGNEKRDLLVYVSGQAKAP